MLAWTAAALLLAWREPVHAASLLIKASCLRIGLFQAPRRPWVDNKDRGQTLEVYLCLGKSLLAEHNCRANTGTAESSLR